MSIRKILEDFREGLIDIEEAERKVKLFEISKVADFGVVDLTRETRAGIPEVVYGERKSPGQLKEIASKILESNGRCIITRLREENLEMLKGEFSEGYLVGEFKDAGIAVIRKRGFRPVREGKVGVLSAGTSDIPVAREAEVIAREMGCETYTHYDIGVAGLHRLFPAIKELTERDVDSIVVVAGMEGALPGVVAGLVDVPVIGLPASSGYGMGGRGRAALLSMLQSCSPGLSVVNIDNGFGAGVVAAIIAKRVEKFRGALEKQQGSPHSEPP